MKKNYFGPKDGFTITDGVGTVDKTPEGKKRFRPGLPLILTAAIVGSTFLVAKCNKESVTESSTLPVVSCEMDGKHYSLSDEDRKNGYDTLREHSFVNGGDVVYLTESYAKENNAKGYSPLTPEIMRSVMDDSRSESGLRKAITGQ